MVTPSHHHHNRKRRSSRGCSSSNSSPLSSNVQNQNRGGEQQLKMLKVSALTDSMLASFQSMAQALSCPLCNRVMEQPQTLSACAHSFCMECIDQYSCNNWQCPVQGCGQSLALRGSRKGKFRKTNPSLETIVTSWKNIHKALQHAPPEWWKDGGGPSSSQQQEEHDTDTDSDDDDEKKLPALAETREARDEKDWRPQQLQCNHQPFGHRKDAEHYFDNILRNNSTNENEDDDDNQLLGDGFGQI